MATVAELQAQLDGVMRLLAAHGIQLPSPTIKDVTKRADYIAYGSAEHAAFIGLVEVQKGEEKDYITWTGADGRTWRLEDEVTPFMTFSDPAQVAKLVLRQKVSALEAGPPSIPPDAPTMWAPRDDPSMFLVT